jgi:hypothetical protein
MGLSGTGPSAEKGISRSVASDENKCGNKELVSEHEKCVNAPGMPAIRTHMHSRARTHTHTHTHAHAHAHTHTLGPPSLPAFASATPCACAHTRSLQHRPPARTPARTRGLAVAARASGVRSVGCFCVADAQRHLPCSRLPALAASALSKPPTARQPRASSGSRQHRPPSRND